MFHKHKWEEKAVVVAPPSRLESFDFEGRSKRVHALLRNITQGTTTYVLKCSCGDMKTIECFGVVKS